jgi:uncharacterized cupin superfamily protein
VDDQARREDGMSKTEVREAEIEQTEDGLVAKGEGWFVMNARDSVWRYVEGRGGFANIEGDQEWQVGVNLFVLEPGNPMSMYHWEADQEDFLVISGEALLIAEGEERPLRQWDFVHCPPGMKHNIVGAGGGTCVVLAVGARTKADSPDWGGYTVDEASAKYGGSADVETNDAEVAYAKVPWRTNTRYREGWLAD